MQKWLGWRLGPGRSFETHAGTVACFAIALYCSGMSTIVAENSAAAEWKSGEFANIFSPDHELQFKAGTLDKKNDHLWLAVVQQPKGTIFERGARKDLHLWRVGLDGQVALDISISSLLAGKTLQLESADPVKLTMCAAEQRHSCVAIAMSSNEGVRLTIVSTNGQLMHDTVVLRGTGTDLRSISTLTENRVLITTIKTLAIVSYDGTQRRLVRSAEREGFLAALPITPNSIVALKGSAAPGQDVNDLWRARLSLSLISIADLSRTRSMPLTENPALIVSVQMSRMADGHLAVLAAEVDSFDVEEGTWVLSVLDADLNPRSSSRLASVPYRFPPTRALVGGWLNDRLIAGHVTRGDFWIGLFNDDGSLLHHYTLPEAGEIWPNVGYAELMPDPNGDQVFVPMTVYADHNERTEGGIQILRLYGDN